MKTFSELSKVELKGLSEIQVDAYIDIELATQNIVKPVEAEVEYPNFVKMNDIMPETDTEVFQVDGYSFPDIETAQKFSAFVGSLPQVKTEYDYYSKGENVYYVTNSKYEIPQVNIKKMYSQAKYVACKAKIKAIREKQQKENESNDGAVESVVNYEAIDNVKYAIKKKVREAIDFFANVEQIAKDYTKYMTITNDKETALKTLYTVYNVQDAEMKSEIEALINSKNE